MKSRTAFDSLCEGANKGWAAWSLFTLRLLMGVMFFWAGWTKVTAEWSATGYLSGASGPFAEWFQAMAGSPVVDMLNAWGLLFLGIALIFGLFLRTASALGVALMALYYLAGFENNTAHGLIDEHIVYINLLVILMAFGAGNIVGVDGYLERLKGVRERKWLQLFLG